MSFLRLLVFEVIDALNDFYELFSFVLCPVRIQKEIATQHTSFHTGNGEFLLDFTNLPVAPALLGSKEYLYLIPLLTLDDCWVVILPVILWQHIPVFHGFMGKVVLRVCFLIQDISAVFLVLEDATDCACEFHLSIPLGERIPCFVRASAISCTDAPSTKLS